MNELHYAGFWWRVLACFLDLIISMIFGFVIAFVLCILFIVVGLALGVPLATAISSFKSIGTPVGYIIAWFYFAFMESSPWQATLGKKICKMTVTDVEGNRLSFLRATARFWSRQISGAICGIGFIMAAFTIRKQTLHDKIAGTIVLRQVD